jgi:hypothetical protein
MYFRLLIFIFLISVFPGEHLFAQQPKKKLPNSRITKNYYPLCEARAWMELEICCGIMQTGLYDTQLLVDVLPDSSVVFYDKNNLSVLPKTRTNYYTRGCILYYKDKVGFLSGDGQHAIPPDLDKISGFKAEGKYFIVSKNGRMDIIDSTARLRSPLRFKYLYPDHDNYFFAMSDDSLFGIVDNSGQYMIEPKHKSISHYDEKNKCAMVEASEGKWIIIDKYGKQIHPSLFDFPRPLNKFAILSQNKLKGVLDGNLKQIVPFIYGNLKSDKGLFICGPVEIYYNDPYRLDIYQGNGELLVSKAEEYLRLSDSAIAVRKNGEWSFYLNKSIYPVDLKNISMTKTDLPLELGLIGKKQNKHYSSWSIVQVEYRDSIGPHQWLINNYLLHKYIEQSLTKTSQEDFWLEELQDMPEPYNLYKEDFESWTNIENDPQNPDCRIINKERLVYQPYYTNTLSWKERLFNYRNSQPTSILTISANYLLDDFFEYKEAETNQHLIVQQAFIVKNSIKWITLEEILQEPLYKSILNKMLKSKIDSVSRKDELQFSNPEDLMGATKYYSFTPKGLSFHFSDYYPEIKMVLPYKELLLYFKKSKIIKRLEVKFRDYKEPEPTIDY